MLFPRSDDTLFWQYRNELDRSYLMCVAELLRDVGHCWRQLDGGRDTSRRQMLGGRLQWLEAAIERLNADAPPMQLSEYPGLHRLLPESYAIETIEALAFEPEVWWSWYEANASLSAAETLPAIRSRTDDALALIHDWQLPMSADGAPRRSLLNRWLSASKYGNTARANLAALERGKAFELNRIALGCGVEAYAEIREMIRYKLLFVYLNFLPSDIRGSDDWTEPLEDAYRKLSAAIMKKLRRVAEDELWVLGSNEIEMWLTAENLDIDIRQYAAAQKETGTVVRSRLIRLVERPWRAKLGDCIRRLSGHETIPRKLVDRLHAFRSLYKELNEALLELAELYEQREIHALVRDQAIDSPELFGLFLRELGYEDDPLAEGDWLQPDRCVVIASEPTDNPELEYAIKTIHQRGLTLGGQAIRKNIVTVYRLQ